MSNKARAEAFRERWRKGADPSETDMTDLFHYIDELEVALDQQGHTVTAFGDDLFVDHPIGCRCKPGDVTLLSRWPLWEAADLPSN
jgi:hypothetical protein